MSVRKLNVDITRYKPKLRHYWIAYGVISGRSGHVDRGPEWSFFKGLHAIATALAHVEAGDFEEVA